jgi:hypothetical protein
MGLNGTSIRLKRLALFLLFSVSTGSVVSAQPRQGSGSPANALIPGTTVWITDFNGLEERARVVGLDGDIVTTTAGGETRRRRTTDIMRIKARRSDSLVNGALIGAGAAIASGLLLCRAMEPWDVCNDAGPIVRFGAFGAGIGIGIDALIRGRRTVYEARGSSRLDFAPLLGRGAGGVQVSVRF